MDLTFSELDEYNFQDSGFDHNNFNENNNSKNDVINVNTNLTTYTNYWHNNEYQDNLKKNSTMKPLTYDDILNSLNLKAKNGNLEFIEKNKPSFNEHVTVKKQAITFDPTLNINLNINVKKQQDNHVQMPEIDKNSYIYNKYFKNYKDESTIEHPKKPLTREEYIQEYNRQLYEKKRIEQIKSKKLMFTRGNDVNISISNPNHNLNKLFRM